MSLPPVAERLLRWFDVHGRHDLPWQHPREAYRVWISEVMLQQTQVGTVIPYFERFMARFPDVETLAAAPQDEVLRHWAGLGYYARARNLHRAAQQIVAQHGGEFPQHLEAVCALPGVGRSTAGAILAQAHGQRLPILDGNVRRVLARHGGIEGWPGQPSVQARLWALAESHLPQTRLADYTQALMDLGSLLCRSKSPECTCCPLREDCIAHAHGRIAELPGAKPRRHRPQRTSHLLLVQNAQGDVLVLRRPPAGIWGGLWCPPLVSVDEDWRALAQTVGADPEPAQILQTIKHAFTHFDLDLHPLLLHASATPRILSENDRRAWIKLAQPDAWPGLPAPIRKLLVSLHGQAKLSLLDSPDINSSCPAPSTASSSTGQPKGSTARPTPARSVSASTKTSREKPGSSGSSTRRG